MDNGEKGIQIPLMVRIFRGARKVLAWLGPGGLDSEEEKCMRLLEHLSRRRRGSVESQMYRIAAESPEYAGNLE